MTRADFLEIFKIPVHENISTTELVVGDLDDYHNLHQKEWFQYVDAMGLFMSRYPNLPYLDISTTVDDNSYDFMNANKFSSNSTTGVVGTAVNSIYPITDANHAAFISTDHIAPGDRFYPTVGALYYDIVQVAEGTLYVKDTTSTLTGTLTYNVRSRPLFPIIIQYRKGTSSTDYFQKMRRNAELVGREDLQEYNESSRRYTVNGNSLEIYPNIDFTGTIRVHYAPYPVPFSSYISNMTNPFGFEDDITEAYAYFLAAKWWEDRPGDNDKLVQKCNARCQQKLMAIKSAGQIAWGNK